jgi:hypothetical protein
LRAADEAEGGTLHFGKTAGNDEIHATTAALGDLKLIRRLRT